ncbi:hypothetical protein AKJ16_DCAP02518 [Drosera capensis]
MEVDRAVALAQMKQAILDLGSSADNYEDGTLFRFLAARSMEPEKAAKMFVEKALCLKMEEDKETALAQVRQAVQDLGSSTDGYGDATLMRFLIARSMVPEMAAKMFVQWQEWRASFVPSGSIPEDEVGDQLDDRKVFLGGLTKEGYPLMIVKGSRHYPTKDRLQFKKFAVHALDKAIASAYKGGRENGNEKIIVAVDLGQIPYKNLDPHEFAVHALDKGIASAYKGGRENGNEKIIVAVDLGQIPYKNLDPHGMIIGFQLLQSYYPERLAKCYMLNMTRFLIMFVYSEEEKREFVKHVGEDIVPEEYGGKAKLVAIQDVTI